MPNTSFENRPVRPEDDYTPLPNRVYSEFLSLFSGPELKVWLTIYRLTAGWWRPNAVITQQELADSCAIDRKTLRKAIVGLQEKKFLARFEMGGRTCYAVHWLEFSDRTIDSDGEKFPIVVGKNSPSDGEKFPIETDSDSSLYRKENLGNKSRARATPDEPEHPTPAFPTDRPIDKWVEEEARARGLVVRINSAAKRQVLNAVDSPEFRENIWGKLVDLTEEVPGENVTDRIMALAGRETGAPKPQRSFSAPIGHRSPQTRPQGDSGGRNTYSERKPPTKFAERLRSILEPYTTEPILPADWICHDLEALSLRLKTFDADLIRFAQGHSGASLAAVLMAFRTAYASPKDIKRRESEDAMERAKAKLRAERTAEAAKKGVKL